MKTLNSSLHPVILFQTIISLLVEFIFIFPTANRQFKTLNLFNISLSIVLLIALVLAILSKRLHFLSWSNTVVIIIFPAFNLFLIPIFFRTMNGFLKLGIFSELVFILSLFLINIPLFKLELDTLETPVIRFLFIFVFYTAARYSPLYYPTYLPKILNQFLDTYFWFSIFMLFSWVLIFNAWSNTWKFNIKVLPNNNYQIWAVIILVFYMIWFSFFDQFINLGTSWSEIFGSWSYPISQLHFSWYNLMYALFTGILEESFRWANLQILLPYFQNKFLPILGPILISAFFFGIYHYTLSYTLNLNSILYVIDAFVMRLVLAGIYLYTGKLYITILFHAAIDLVGFKLGSLVNYNLGLLDYPQQLVLIILINMIFFIFLFTGKRRKGIAINVSKLIKKSNLT